MREIKYRAYGEKFGMLYGVETAYDTLGSLLDGSGKEQDYSWNSFNQVIAEANAGEIALMEFTGLKDKNGKEIWEGDIVKTRVMHDYDVFSEDYFLEVKFERGQFNPMCEKKKTPYRILPLYYDFEVVGNVHENKELLK